MIDAGQIEYALVVDGEGSRRTQERTIERLARPEATRADVQAQFATLTLGSGAAAMVLGPADRHTRGPPVPRRRGARRHRAPRPVRRRPRAHAHRHARPARRRARARHGRVGGGPGRVRLVGHGPLRRPPDLAGAHRRHVRGAGIDPGRVPLTFPTRGNIGPASVPFTLAGEVDSLERRRPGAAHGHRLGPQRLLRRDRLVSGGSPSPPRRSPPRRCPGSTRPGRGWSPPTDVATACRAPGTCSTTGAEPTAPGRCCASTATRPGPTSGAGSWPTPPSGLAGGRRRPARHGLLRAHRRSRGRSRSASTTSARSPTRSA